MLAHDLSDGEINTLVTRDDRDRDLINRLTLQPVCSQHTGGRQKVRHGRLAFKIGGVIVIKLHQTHCVLELEVSNACCSQAVSVNHLAFVKLFNEKYGTGNTNRPSGTGIFARCNWQVIGPCQRRRNSGDWQSIPLLNEVVNWTIAGQAALWLTTTHRAYQERQ